MPFTIRKLSLGDLILNRRGSFTFRAVLGAFGIALRLFFRRIETVNESIVPAKGGLIFVINHPNGLIDPALVFVAMPRKISFLAKSTLFQMPVISFLLRTVEALPLYRRIDAGEDVSKNQKTFEVCRALLKKSGSIALFPEGVSHNSPKLLPAKTGAARIAIGTVSSGEPINVEIVPVGLYYTSKTTFRSEALLHFGTPFRVEPVELDSQGQPPRDAVKELTGKIEHALREVTLNAETEAKLDTANIAERIFSSAAENDNLGGKFEFLQNFVALTSDEHNPAKDQFLINKLHEYDKKLDTYGIEAGHLSLARFSRWFVIKEAFVQTWPLLILSPLALLGSIIHFPAYKLCRLFAHLYTRHGADDVASTIKVLAGMVFMPLTWLIIATALYFIFDWRIALISLPISILSGYIALYTLEQIVELSGWAKAIWLFLTKREIFLRMFVERRELQAELREFD